MPDTFCGQLRLFRATVTLGGAPKKGKAIAVGTLKPVRPKAARPSGAGGGKPSGSLGCRNL